MGQPGGKMWLIISAIFAIIATSIWTIVPEDRYHLCGLSFAFWGLTTMITVDHVIGWIREGSSGEFFEISSEALVLSLCMIISILAVWELFVVLDKLKNNAKQTIQNSNIEVE